MADQVNDENRQIWNGTVGLIRVSEYIRTNSNKSRCGTMQLVYNKENNNCYQSNWMYTTSVNHWWTITASTTMPHFVYLIDMGGYDGDTYVRGRIQDNSSIFSADVRPVVYLKSNLKLSGSGTQSDPYTIN